MLVDDADDEMARLLNLADQRVKSRQSASVMFVSSPCSVPASEETSGIERTAAFAERACSEFGSRFVKARLCTFRSRPIRERIMVAHALGRALETLRVPLALMWMSDDVTDGLHSLPLCLNAFYFSLDLVGQGLESSTAVLLKSVELLLASKKAVHFALVIRKHEDILREQVLLRELAAVAQNFGHPAVSWGVQLLQPKESLYCLPEVCEVASTFATRERVRVAGALQALGIPLNIDVAAIHQARRCPYQLPWTRIFDWEGGEFNCLREVLSGTAGASGSDEGFSTGLQFDRTPAHCRACALLPFCLGDCPRDGLDNVCGARRRRVFLRLRESRLRRI
jgi:hypothetical protein